LSLAFLTGASVLLWTQERTTQPRDGTMANEYLIEGGDEGEMEKLID